MKKATTITKKNQTNCCAPYTKFTGFSQAPVFFTDKVTKIYSTELQNSTLIFSPLKLKLLQHVTTFLHVYPTMSNVITKHYTCLGSKLAFTMYKVM